METQEELNIRQWVQDMADRRGSRLIQKEWCRIHETNPICADIPEPVFGTEKDPARC